MCRWSPASVVVVDADALDAAIASHRNRWYTRGCMVGQMVSKLPDGPYRSRLVEHMNASPDVISHSAIIAAVEETIGVRLRSDTLLRHRAHRCSCGAEVYE